MSVSEMRTEDGEVVSVTYSHGHEAAARSARADRLQELVES